MISNLDFKLFGPIYLIMLLLLEQNCRAAISEVDYVRLSLTIQIGRQPSNSALLNTILISFEMLDHVQNHFWVNFSA